MKPPPMPEPTMGVCLNDDISVWGVMLSQLEARDAQWAALLADAVAAERERCARVCDGMRDGGYDQWDAGFDAGAKQCADAIRAQTDSKGD